MKRTTLVLPFLAAATLNVGCVSTLHESGYHPERVTVAERTASHAPYRVSELTLVLHEDVLQYWEECDAWKPGQFSAQVKAAKLMAKSATPQIASWFGTDPGEETPAMAALYHGLLFSFGNERVKSFGLPGHTMGFGTIQNEELWLLARDAKLARYGWPKTLTAESLTDRLAAAYPGTFSAKDSATPLHVLLAFAWNDRDYDVAATMTKGKNGVDAGAGTQSFGVWVLSGSHAPLPVKTMPRPGKEFQIEYRSSMGGLEESNDASGDAVRILTKSFPGLGGPQQSSEYCEFVESAVAAAVVEALNTLPDDIFETIVGK